MDFRIGDKVVHKTHGVGEICGIETKNFGGGDQDYYLLRIISTGLMVRFPKGVSTPLVRTLVTDKEIQEVYNILKKPRRTYSCVWNRRKKEFLEKIKSGSLQDIAEVMRDLSGAKSGKPLSYGEKELLEKARARIVNEISVAQSLGEEEVGATLDRVLLM